ncbi:G/U mismatch-specific uracil DNA glycosylase [Colletotrichum chlorophyti]|uniref:G/U mismatch-specific uracil DNA glycosylase n=1 Tax=Colletotrichum chlorophyti TaxID=708187 RepID=A0A1Q8REW7_9PEZI|nr:G/U mismatch-specific uracil DNA glycosylase [Colletotrichum chlorophyti]
MESPFFDGTAPQSKLSPSFQGRLQLQEYLFKPAPTQSMPASEASASATPPAPLRRSPRNRTPLGPVPSANRVTKHTGAVAKSSPSPSSATSPASDSAPLSDATTNPARAKPKRKRQKSGYAPPSTYAHFSPLTDILAPDLLILFVGLNPGLQTARLGHAYAHPSNLFWKLLHSSGITPRLCRPSEDRDLPHLYALGNTNIVSRPSRNGSELSKSEMDAGVAILEEKIRGCRPETVCLVGKGIWESVWRVRKGRAIRKEEFSYGWQGEGENMGVVEGEWAGARVFVATSTSGLAATLRPAEKERIWRELGVWCERRRAERKAEA